MLSVTAQRQPESKMRFLVRGLLIAVAGLGIWMATQAAVIPAKAMVAQFLLNSAFEASKATGTPQKPWPWADMTPVARLRVPRLGVDQIVLSGGSGEAMAFGPTVLPGTAAPGQPGTTVLTAHRDTHFRFLERLEVDDSIRLESEHGEVKEYEVIGTEVVRWDGFSIPHADGESRLVLVTCFPFDSTKRGAERYVVHGSPDGQPISQ
ncbi:class GN sortase [Spectribacter hydrogenoxidans]|uniref:Class GN sortase n=1 Tax=Spectribacter hydrogenoxidans TaxID=3075608 RepID=A0ABU3C451_9GAMM|nr:class GN sortase [Salinisphaera sp. W335]MDT0636346.1 class GN sortase [Salinisphaera sp. W335]